MKIIDKSGRLFGKVSVIDIIIIVAVLVLGIGFIHRQTSERFREIASPDEVFYVTFEAPRTRDFNVNSVAYGDVMYRLHAQHAMGTVVDVRPEQAYDIIRRSDGTGVFVPMEERYRLLITLRVRGTVNERGYFVNGTDHLAPGLTVILVSNRVFFRDSFVESISMEPPIREQEQS